MAAIPWDQRFGNEVTSVCKNFVSDQTSERLGATAQKVANFVKENTVWCLVGGYVLMAISNGTWLIDAVVFVGACAMAYCVIKFLEKAE